MNGICLRFHGVDSKNHSWEVLTCSYVSYAPATIPFLPSCCLEHGCYIMDHENEGHTQKMVEWESERSNIRHCLTSPELSSCRFYMRNKPLYILAIPSVIHNPPASSESWQRVRTSDLLHHPDYPKQNLHLNKILRLFLSPLTLAMY